MSPSMLDMASVREYLGKKLLCQVTTPEKRLALTFDDGPNPHNTPLLLELLAGKGIKATFFVVGRRVRRFRDLLKQTADAGHEIGNHGDHHVPLSFLPRAIISRELEVCSKLVEGVTGRRPRFMRPPMGWFNDKVLEVTRGLGYEPVIGSVHPQDSRQPGLDTIVRRVRRRIEPGAIIIMHDGGWRIGVDRSQTLAAVDLITDELLDSGYRFQTLSELVDDTNQGKSTHEPV
jgi:peptidoglycan/xylan/chitin deacetylase (PgdA/CDA1 family)